MTLSLLSPLRDCRLTFLDVETTGASPELGDRVIEVGFAHVEHGEVTGTFSQLLDPRRPISPGITALTGITPLMCCGQPVFPDLCNVVADQLGLDQPSILVGHNVAFDLSFLRYEFRRCGHDHINARLGPALVLDTVRLARNRFGRGGNGLQRLAQRFGLIPSSPDTPHVAHRALPDALTTYRVFSTLIDPLGGWSATLADVLAAQGGVFRFEGSTLKSVLPTELEEALGRNCPVEMEYIDHEGQRTVRVVTPLEVRKFRGELVLLAWCSLRRERRSFKLAGISRLLPVDRSDSAS